MGLGAGPGDWADAAGGAPWRGDAQVYVPVADLYREGKPPPARTPTSGSLPRSWTTGRSAGDWRSCRAHRVRSSASAADEDDCVLVVGTHEHHGLGRVLHGSVSHYVLSHAPCPVVAVPPPDASSSRSTLTPTWMPWSFRRPRGSDDAPVRGASSAGSPPSVPHQSQRPAPEQDPRLPHVAVCGPSAGEALARTGRPPVRTARLTQDVFSHVHPAMHQHRIDERTARYPSRVITRRPAEGGRPVLVLG